MLKRETNLIDKKEKKKLQIFFKCNFNTVIHTA